MPYTLWNIRDLARHSGLAVERSFKFQASAYPGYHHARTIGVVKNAAGEKSETGWKGEERPARSYVFVKKDEVAPVVSKRKRTDPDTEDEEEEEVEGLSELEELEEQVGGEDVADHSGEEEDSEDKEDGGSEGENQD
jgi:25S rRNA (uracil2634-N3)-methyltransferase